nr:protein kinase [uncultured Rhodopila sp.]
MIKDTNRDEAPWPSFALPRDTAVNGYRIDRVLGSGGFGITYLAHDMLRQPFAIKEYYPRQLAARRQLNVMAASAEDEKLFEECRERFLREAQALVVVSRVAPPGTGIARVRTYFEAHGTCFLVMDYVEGETLASVLRREPGGLSAARVSSLLSQLLSSIRVVHRAGLMHRDIKPANIIVRDDGGIVLIDFGSSRPAANTELATYTQIYSGGFAPPEQMLGMDQGEFSDIYAIGAVAYQAIGGSVVDALARQSALAAGKPDPQPSAERIGAGRYPGSLLAAIDAALAPDPAQRLQTVEAVLAALGRGDPSGEPTVVQSRRAAPAALPPPRRRRGVWGFVAGAGALALCVAAYFETRGPVPSPVASRQDVVASPPSDAAPPQPLPETTQPSAAGVAVQQSTTANDQPAAAPTVSPPPLEQAQREAIAIPPPESPSVPIPPPQTAPSPLEMWQAAAQSLPCAVLNIASGQDGIRVSGIAAAGPELDQLLADLHHAGHLADDIARTDHFACAPMAMVRDFVQRTWNSAAPTFAIRLDQRSVASGARLGIRVTTTPPALYVDLYQGDGSVRHLSRPTRSASGKPGVEWVATPPAGPGVIVAIGATAPLDLGSRPETERASDYLAALRPRLQHAAEPPAADVAIVTVRAAEPVVARMPQPQRAIPVQSAFCANINSRAQLGETLSHDELAALRTECRF